MNILTYENISSLGGWGKKHLNTYILYIICHKLRGQPKKSLMARIFKIHRSYRRYYCTPSRKLFSGNCFQTEFMATVHILCMHVYVCVYICTANTKVVSYIYNDPSVSTHVLCKFDINYNIVYWLWVLRGGG